MSQSDSFQVDQLEKIYVVTLGNTYQTLDGGLVKQAESQILEVVNHQDCHSLVIDMTHVRFFGSAFLESLIRIWNQLKPRPQSSMKLCGLQPYCQEVFEITHLDQIWGLYATREEALESLQSAGT